MGDELSEIALETPDQTEQGMLLDAVEIVRQHRSEIELRFRRSFTNVFERRLFNRKAEEVSPTAASGMLALLDDAELQAKLEVDRLVQRSRGRLDLDEVLGIRARLASLVDREWFDEEKHPASPDAVFEALKESIADVTPDVQMRTRLLDAFEPHVSSQLNAVYNTVNDRLKAEDVLPVIRPQVTAVGGGRARAASSVTPEGRTESGQQSGEAGGSRTSGQGAGGAGTATESVAQLDARIEELLSEMSAGSTGAKASAAQILTDPELFAVDKLPLPQVPAPLLDALSGMQTAEGALLPPEELLGELTKHSRDSGSALDQLTVEIVSMVFDYIYADKRLSDSVKQQLLRLQVVAIKAALIDRSFFARRRHPMRMLIDRVSEIAADPDVDVTPGSELLSGIVEVIESLLLGFDRDLSIFDDAREKIDALLDEESARRSARLAKVTQAAERAEALGNALVLARGQLADRVDPNTPPFLKAFLDQWWSLVLAQCQLAGAEAKMPVDEVLSVAEGLIWSVVPKGGDEVSALAGMVPKLIRGVNQGLAILKIADAERSTFFDALLQQHTKAISAAKQGTSDSSKKALANVRLGTDGRVKFTPSTTRSEPLAEHPPVVEAQNVSLGDLHRGDSIEIDLKGDGEFLAFRLAWVSPGQQVFVLSRHPEGAMSLERAKLAALFDRDRARIVEADVSIDRAIGRIAEAV